MEWPVQRRSAHRYDSRFGQLGERLQQMDRAGRDLCEARRHFQLRLVFRQREHGAMPQRNAGSWKFPVNVVRAHEHERVLACHAVPERVYTTERRSATRRNASALNRSSGAGAGSPVY